MLFCYAWVTKKPAALAIPLMWKLAFKFSPGLKAGGTQRNRAGKVSGIRQVKKAMRTKARNETVAWPVSFRSAGVGVTHI